MLPNKKFSFSYSVYVVESNQTWPHRFDHYLDFGNPVVQWFHIICALLIVTGSSCVFGLIINSALDADSAALRKIRKVYRKR